VKTITIVYGSMILLTLAIVAEAGLALANTRSIDRLDRKLEGLEDNAHESSTGDIE